MKGSRTNTNDTDLELRTGTTRTAIYVRYASGVPEVSNAADQISACTEYAQKQGWKIAEEFVQTDIGAPGISLMECKSLLHLLEVAEKEPRPIDCVLVADISCLGRSLDRVIKLVNAFHGRGVFVRTVRGEFDSRNFRPGAWATKDFLHCGPRYLRTTARSCPMCGR